jgi:hypothetical protein
MNDPLAVGFLSVSQQIGLKNVALTNTYDLILAALSWERRATTGLRATSGLNGRLVLLKFASSSPEIEAAKEANRTLGVAIRERYIDGVSDCLSEFLGNEFVRSATPTTV